MSWFYEVVSAFHYNEKYNFTTVKTNIIDERTNHQQNPLIQVGKKEYNWTSDMRQRTLIYLLISLQNCLCWYEKILETRKLQVITPQELSLHDIKQNLKYILYCTI